MRPLVKSAANTEESRIGFKHASTRTDLSECVGDGKYEVREVILVETEFSGVLWLSSTVSCRSSPSRTLLHWIVVRHRWPLCVVATLLDCASRFPAITVNLVLPLGGGFSFLTYVLLAELACLGSVFSFWDLEPDTTNLNQFAGSRSSW